MSRCLRAGMMGFMVLYNTAAGRSRGCLRSGEDKSPARRRNWIAGLALSILATSTTELV